MMKKWEWKIWEKMGEMGGGREMIGPDYFLSKPTKTWSPQIREKMEVKMRNYDFDEILLRHQQAKVFFFFFWWCLFHFLSFLLISFVFICFFHSHFFSLFLSFFIICFGSFWLVINKLKKKRKKSKVFMHIFFCFI